MGNSPTSGTSSLIFEMFSFASAIAEKFQKCTTKTDYVAEVFVKQKISKMREEVLELCGFPIVQ